MAKKTHVPEEFEIIRQKCEDFLLELCLEHKHAKAMSGFLRAGFDHLYDVFLCELSPHKKEIEIKRMLNQYLRFKKEM